MSDLRESFVQQFLSTTAGLDPFEHSLEELIEMFDMELAAAKKHWSSVNIDREFHEMGQWLSDRGYVEPGTAED
jgi:hypothetical protein